jgi:hypothetical protein
MKPILGRLALLLLVMLIGVSIGRRTEMPMQQQSAQDEVCMPGPGIEIDGKWYDTVCHRRTGQ